VKVHPELDHPEVILHDGAHLLETVTSNIAIHMPTSNPDEPEWVTPRLETHSRPFLHGVMRRYLLERGIVREDDITVANWEEARRDGRRVIGFNGLR
jgi:branched-subunit amino acid aminotransferase/4-amino-4-deoxychorismate lyase